MSDQAEQPLFESSLKSLPFLHRGKVRRQGCAGEIATALGADGLSDAFRRVTEAAA